MDWPSIPAAVSITSSRDVSDPRTDPGVRVRGPEVGSLTSRLLSGAVHSRGEGAALNASGAGAPIRRNANVLQKKSSRHVAAIVGFGRL